MGCVLFCVKIMSMIDKYWYEFSKLYARIMRLEHKIKHSAVQALVQYYGDNTLDTMMRFFNNKRRRKRYLCNEVCRFDIILNNNKLDNNGKFVALVNILYLSDLLVLMLQTEQFDKPEILKVFYTKVPNDIHDLDKHIKDLVNLRNCVAHFNFDLYKKYKIQYLDTLYTFELHLGNNVHGIEKLPKFDTKPKTAEIIRQIVALRPDLLQCIADDPKDNETACNQDRLLLSLFDDIALYNGYDASELPSPWTILRQVFILKKEIKKSNKTIHNNNHFYEQQKIF